jgi:hypothetical protein
VNKKKQKNFVTWDNAWGDDIAPRNCLGSKSFLVLFFKKEPLLSLALQRETITT